MIRRAAREAMKGRYSLLIGSAAIFMLCLGLPVIVVEQIMGLWDILESATESYLGLLDNPTYEAMNEWMATWSDKVALSPASVIFLIVAPGPLTLGLSSVWLHVLRGKEAYTDMVFSGFGNFLRVFLMDTARRIFMIIFAILFIIPGVIIYYRYSLTFFLLADNPAMKPFEALIYSRYFMKQNKGNRFMLDFSFIGWLALSFLAQYLLSNLAFSLMFAFGVDVSMFTEQLVGMILGSIAFAPLLAYRGVAAAEYYHRVICRDPRDPRNENANFTLLE